MIACLIAEWRRDECRRKSQVCEPKFKVLVIAQEHLPGIRSQYVHKESVANLWREWSEARYMLTSFESSGWYSHWTDVDRSVAALIGRLNQRACSCVRLICLLSKVSPSHGIEYTFEATHEVLECTTRLSPLPISSKANCRLTFALSPRHLEHLTRLSLPLDLLEALAITLCARYSLSRRLLRDGIGER